MSYLERRKQEADFCKAVEKKLVNLRSQALSENYPWTSSDLIGAPLQQFKKTEEYQLYLKLRPTIDPTASSAYHGN